MGSVVSPFFNNMGWIAGAKPKGGANGITFSSTPENGHPNTG